MQRAPTIPCGPLQDLRAALATRRLQDAVGQTASNQLFILQAPTTVARVSVCGNQVCEHGERPTNGTANGGELAAGGSKRLREFPPKALQISGAVSWLWLRGLLASSQAEDHPLRRIATGHGQPVFRHPFCCCGGSLSLHAGRQWGSGSPARCAGDG